MKWKASDYWNMFLVVAYFVGFMVVAGLIGYFFFSGTIFEPHVPGWN